MNRIAVIGPGGAGKTHLARALAVALDLPVIHLDAYYYGPGWQPCPPARWEERQRRLAAGERWVMDGNYAGTLALRLGRADTVVFLDTPPLLCGWQSYDGGRSAACAPLPTSRQVLITGSIAGSWATCSPSVVTGVPRCSRTRPVGRERHGRPLAFAPGRQAVPVRAACTPGPAVPVPGCLTRGLLEHRFDLWTHPDHRLGDMRLRKIVTPRVAPAPTGLRIRTRLRVNQTDAEVLRRLGVHLGRLANIDLAVRCGFGLDHDKHHWAARKQALTGSSSSRWAGAITKRSNDEWTTAWQNKTRYAASLRRSIATLERRLARPVGSQGNRESAPGYRTQAVRYEKQRRLQILKARLDRLETELKTGNLKIVRGGRRLLNTRHNLEAANLSEGQWRQSWEATRWFIQANGEADAPWGNSTIRVYPTGEVDLVLPPSLGDLANQPRRRYRLSCLAEFHHHAEDWSAQSVGGAVAYTIWFSPERRRWYLDASWTSAPKPYAAMEQAAANGVLAVDFNADHLACWIVDRAGNPTGKPSRIPLDLVGSGPRRDAQLRHAVSRLIRLARARDVHAIAVEDLRFDDRVTSRERHGRQRRFRHLLSSFPTSAFRRRLVVMSARAGLTVVAVDPAYTSQWGQQHWQQPPSTQRRPITRHESAAVVIARRSLGHRARRRPGVTDPHQKDAVRRAAGQALQGARGCQEPRRPGGGQAAQSRGRPDPARGPRRETRPPNTVRGGRRDRSLRAVTPSGTLGRQLVGQRSQEEAHVGDDTHRLGGAAVGELGDRR
jgi:IS605 OrfB family transposase